LRPTARILRSWVPALIFMGVLFRLSSLPGNEIHLPPFPNSDKVVHFCAYAFLGWLISLRRVLAGTPGTGVDFKAMIVGMLYGISDEFHQSFVPMRDSSVYDWTADALGVTVGVLICARMFRNRLQLNQAARS
jgi:VanZ family protein